MCPTASERAAALADDFAAANAEAVAFTRACPSEAWGRTVPGEGWTVGVTLHHIAETYEQSRRWVAAMSSGDGVDDTAEAIDKANAALRKKIEAKATEHPQYSRCQWLGRCYYCYFAGNWWRIGCM